MFDCPMEAFHVSMHRVTRCCGDCGGNGGEEGGGELKDSWGRSCQCTIWVVVAPSHICFSYSHYLHNSH